MHHGALGIIRSGGRLGIPVFDMHGGGPVGLGRSRYNRGSITLPRGADAEQRLAALHEFSRRHGRAVLIPVDDASAMFVSDYTASLAEGFLFPHQPPGLARALASKREMHRLCLEHRIPTPAALFPETEAEISDYAGEAAFPVVVKRIDNSLWAAPDAPSVAIAQGPQELLDAFRLMRSSQSSNVMLQEYIPGTAETIWMLNGYFDSQSRCLLAFTGQKIRQSPPYRGATTLGVCRPNQTVEEITKRFMKALGYRGILDLGCRWDARDGQYKLLDVNPRIGATFRLFVARDGMDVLRALYLDLTGQAVTDDVQPDGRRWLVELLDVRSAWTYMRAGDLTMKSWLASLRGVDELAWWARDDPLPLLFQSCWLFSTAARRRVGASMRRARRLRPGVRS
jgi:D-aspartate ligase